MEKGRLDYDAGRALTRSGQEPVQKACDRDDSGCLDVRRACVDVRRAPTKSLLAAGAVVSSSSPPQPVSGRGRYGSRTGREMLGAFPERAAITDGDYISTIPAAFWQHRETTSSEWAYLQTSVQLYFNAHDQRVRAHNSDMSAKRMTRAIPLHGAEARPARCSSGRASFARRSIGKGRPGQD